MTAPQYDVVIMGGGLAGLSLALQLKQTRPATSVAVLEKRSRRAPEAAFKVGESLSGVAGVYFRDMLGLRDHLEERHITKHGVRFFFPAGDNSDITRRVEFANVGIPELPLHHVDRGVFENEIWDRAVAAGAEVLGDTRVKDVELGEDRHVVSVLRGGPDGEAGTVRGRWLVDAAGRAHILKRKLGLHKDVPHTVNAAWLRLAGGLDIEDWGAGDEDWLARMPERGYRTHHTNHLMGEGYFVWLIQLGTGPISLGVCADSRFHPFEEMNTLEGWLRWMHEHEPQLGATVEDRRDDVMDFLTVEDYAYSSTRAFSPERWCTTGEAGTFADPFLSPGSDYISFANNYITNLVQTDLDGGDVADRLEMYNFLYYRTFEGFLAGVAGQYSVFADPEVMVPKLAVGPVPNFALIGALFGHGKMTDPEFMAKVGHMFPRVGNLATRISELFAAWGAVEGGQREWQDAHPVLEEFPTQQMLLNMAGNYDDESLVAKVEEGTELFEAIVVIVFHEVVSRLPDAEVDADARVNPAAVSSQPGRWEEEGLFSDDGLTLAEARERVPGWRELWLADPVAS